MKLIYSPASPFVRVVHATIIETGAQVEFEPVKTTPIANADAAVAANPTGRIPSLARDGAAPLFDSRVICRFLNDQTGGALYPQDTIWDVLTLEALANGIMDSGVLISYERRTRPEEEQSATWIEAQWTKIARSLDHLDAGGMAAMQGDVNIGQIAVACALGYIDFRHGDRNWRNGRSNLAAWFEEISKRPSLATTAPSD